MVGLLLCVLLGGQFAAAQVPQDPNAVDVRAESLNVPASVVWTAPNVITAVIRNAGVAPVRVDTTLTISNATFSTDVASTPAEHEALAPGESRTITHTWNGTTYIVSKDAYEPVQGLLTFVFRVDPKDPVQPETDDENNQQPRPGEPAVQRTLRMFGFTLSLEPPEPGEKMEVEGTYTTFGVITNTGNGPDSATIQFTQVTTGWTFRAVDEDPMSFAGTGTQRGVFVEATAPVTASAGSVGRATVQVVSAGAKAANAPEVLATATMTTPVVSQSGRLAVTFTPLTLDISPGGTANYQAEVLNLQNAPATVRLTLVRLTGDATLVPAISPSTAVTVGPGAGAPFAISIPASASALAGVTTWRVHAFSSGTDPEEADASAPLRLRILQTYDVAASLAHPVGSVKPGRTFTADVSVENLGNGADTFRLELTDGPSGWTAPPVQRTLNARQTLGVPVVVSIPNGAAPGHRTLTMRVTSLGSSVETADVLVPLQLLATPIAKLTTPLLAQPIEPQQTITFPITLTNDGNAADTFSLGTTTDASKTQPATGWTITIGGAYAPIPPGGTETHSVTVRAPSTLTATQRGLFFNLTATGSSAAEPTKLELSATPAFPDLRADIVATDPSPTYLNQPTLLKFRIFNTGTANADNAQARLVLKRPSGAEDLNRTFTDIDLGWGTGQTAKEFEVSINSTFASLAATLRVDFNKQIQESDENNNVDTLQIPFRNFDITVSGPADLLSEPGVAVTFDGDDGFRATNAGMNVTDIILSLTSDAGWAQESATHEGVAPGQTLTLPVDFVIPAEPSVEETRLTFKACLADDTAICATKHMQIRVPDKIRPRIDPLLVSKTEVDIDEPVEFRVLVRDARGIQSVKLGRVDPTGQVTLTPMALVAGYYTLNLSFADPGVYRVHVKAEDASTLHNVNTTQASPVAITVVGSGVPRLVLTSPPAPGLIKAGKPIVIAVQSGGAVISAEYEVRGQVVSLFPTSPLQIPTDGWADGAHDLIVRVVAANGASAPTTYTFQVDGTPPNVANVRLNTLNPQPGREVVVTANVTDASGVATTLLRVVHEGSPASEIPMTLVEGSQYSARIQWEDDISTVGVISEDTAGNRGYGQYTVAALLGYDKEGGKSPAASFVFLLAALLVVAIARNRIGGRVQ